MKTALVIILSFVILLGTTACGNNAPANVKKGFEYYVLMDDVATKILKGAKVKEVYMPTEKEKEMIKFISSYEGNVDASLEEQVMADSLKLMRLSLMDIYFMNTIAELDPSKGKDFSEELKAIFKTSQELSEYFSKQGLKHEVK